MSAIDDIAWNELPLVVRHQGEVSVWKSWKRALCAFADPRLWQGTSAYPEYFKRLEGGWDSAGYGVVVMDLDAKRFYSFNDYSSPQVLIFHPEVADGEDESSILKRKALLNLLNDPAARAQVELELYRTPSLVGAIKSIFSDPEIEIRQAPLDEVFGSGMPAQEVLKKLSGNRGECCQVELEGKVFSVGQGTYLPKDWVAGTTPGDEGPDKLIECLTFMQGNGYPPPLSWEAFDEQMRENDIPLTEDDLAELLEESQGEIENEEYAEQVAQLSRAYQALKNSWTLPVARPRLR